MPSASEYIARYGMSRKQLRKYLWRKQKHRCGICNKVIPAGSILSSRVDLDHIHPRSRGGQDIVANLQLTHKKCNSLKGSDHPGCEQCESGTQGQG